MCDVYLGIPRINYE